MIRNEKKIYLFKTAITFNYVHCYFFTFDVLKHITIFFSSILLNHVRRDLFSFENTIPDAKLSSCIHVKALTNRNKLLLNYRRENCT